MRPSELDLSSPDTLVSFGITLSPHLTSATQTHLTDIKQQSGHFTSPYWLAPAAAKSLQSCLTLCDPIDSSSPGSAVPGILQAKILEWVAISFSNAWKWKVKVKWLSHVQLLATRWTAAYKAPPSMGFSRQEYWSGLPLPSLMTLTSWYQINQRLYLNMHKIAYLFLVSEFL